MRRDEEVSGQLKNCQADKSDIRNIGSEIWKMKDHRTLLHEELLDLPLLSRCLLRLSNSLDIGV